MTLVGGFATRELFSEISWPKSYLLDPICILFQCRQVKLLVMFLCIRILPTGIALRVAPIFCIVGYFRAICSRFDDFSSAANYFTG